MLRKILFIVFCMLLLLPTRSYATMTDKDTREALLIGGVVGGLIIIGAVAQVLDSLDRSAKETAEAMNALATTTAEASALHATETVEAMNEQATATAEAPALHATETVEAAWTSTPTVVPTPTCGGRSVSPLDGYDSTTTTLNVYIEKPCVNQKYYVIRDNYDASILMHINEINAYVKTLIPSEHSYITNELASTWRSITEDGYLTAERPLRIKVAVFMVDKRVDWIRWEYYLERQIPAQEKMVRGVYDKIRDVYKADLKRELSDEEYAHVLSGYWRQAGRYDTNYIVFIGPYTVLDKVHSYGISWKEFSRLRNNLNKYVNRLREAQDAEN